MANDIMFNVENDMDKDEVVAVYVTKAEKEALHKYAREIDSTMSDIAGGYLWRGLKAAYRLPEGYFRPAGF